MGYYRDFHLFNIRIYEQEIVPAYHSYFRENDQEPLIKLLQNVSQKLKASATLSAELFFHQKDSDNYIRELKEGVYEYTDPVSGTTRQIKSDRKSQRSLVRDSMIPRIVNALCIPFDRQDVYPEEGAINNAVIAYISEKSAAVRQILARVEKGRGELLEPDLGTKRIKFLRKDIEQINSELARILPPATAVLRKNYDNFHSMVKLALEDSGFTLVLTILE